MKKVFLTAVNSISLLNYRLICVAAQNYKPGFHESVSPTALSAYIRWAPLSRVAMR